MLNYDIQMGEHDRESEVFDNHGNIMLRNPFPGLRPFSIDECHLFFGREGQVDEVLVKLASTRFITVMGYSGSGKSSLMYCGLVPILYGGFMTDAGSSWKVLVSRPGTSPIENLADSILKESTDFEDQSEEDKQLNKTIISALLKSDSEGLVKAIDKLHDHSGQNTLILIDQFEELFRYRNERGKGTPEEAKIYVNLLLEACKSAKSSIYLAITMRSDYVGDCSQFPGLTQMINQSNYLVPQMTRDQKRMAIEGPVAVGGGTIADRLVKRLLNEVGENQDQLPILQHALMRTWDYWIRTREEKEPMDIRHYNAVGKMSEALSQHANEAYDELSSREKEIAETLFKSLTQRTNDSFGMRRPVRLGLVAELAGVTDNDVIEVVDKFRQPGRSFLMPPHNVKLNADSIIEISHESLMRIWIRLKTWVDEEYESAQMYRRLSEAAAMYQIGRTGLWRPPDLQLALNWQKKQRPTRAWAQRYDETFERAIVFLDTSRITYEAEQKNQEMLQRRLLKRAKIVAVVLGIATVISVLFFVFAVTRNIEANKQREFAEEQKLKAQEERDRAYISEAEAKKQRARAEREEQNAREQAEKARQALIIAQQQRNLAQEQSRIAQEQRNIADNEKLIAQSAREEAEKEYQRAERNYTRAQKLLFQSVAQSMAVKSLSIEDNDLKGLLAQQAYTFNKNYEGRTYDPYIYNGLYSALAQIKGKAFNTISGAHRNSIRSVVFENRGNTFYSTGTEGKIVVASLNAPSNTKTIASNPYPNRVLAISPDDKWLANGSDSSAIKVFDLKNPDTPGRLITGHTSYINDLEFLPGQNVFISAGGDRQLRRNDIVTMTSAPIKSTAEQFKTIAVSRNGQWLAGGTLSGKAVLINLDNLSEKILIDQSGTPVHALAFSPDSRFLAIGDEQGVVKIWDMAQSKIDHEFTGQKGRISDLEYSHDGRLLASASLDQTIQMWVTGEIDELPIKMTDNDAYVWDIAFSPDSDYLIAACGDGDLRIWPTKPQLMAEKMCNELSRNMNEDEWKTYVGNDIGFQNTCINLLLNNY
ncbi:High-affnity carbon uptake protein Hat/HatR [Fulvivirga ulvae]|uniref:nSTAND1 domain-containing NTPase n=1 Tax=Fulvivirga ulvae TaxID=2904245 RepID=UPI001F19FA16|nr:High-affnity carbon uptake protein Hat/HatR [Fulvivirga ulvae]UII31545.1 High-affnity carbon uptake protein Hat/HatR [Fulvivirga ulvae]